MHRRPQVDRKRNKDNDKMAKASARVDWGALASTLALDLRPRTQLPFASAP